MLLMVVRLRERIPRGIVFHPRAAPGRGRICVLPWAVQARGPRAGERGGRAEGHAEEPARASARMESRPSSRARAGILDPALRVARRVGDPIRPVPVRVVRMVALVREVPDGRVARAQRARHPDERARARGEVVRVLVRVRLVVLVLVPEGLQRHRVVQLEAVGRHRGAAAGVEDGGARARGERRGGGWAGGSDACGCEDPASSLSRSCSCQSANDGRVKHDDRQRVKQDLR